MRHLLIGPFLVFLCLSTLVISPAADAATIYVTPAGNDANPGTSWDQPKQTVVAAFTAATSGDQIWVAQGIYYERIALIAGVALYGGFNGTETDLAQRNFKNNLTILDGQAAGSVVTSPSGATLTTRIDGFTIRNGKADDMGGGIVCISSSPTIENNIISGNSTSAGSYPNTYGGGIACYFASPKIIHNTITENSSAYGGGIACLFSSPAISNNLITRNSNKYAGAGILCAWELRYSRKTGQKIGLN